jgi:hypothetical protein
MRKVPVPVIGASYSPFFVCFIDLFLGDLGFFLFSNYFFNYLSQKSFIIDVDPAMSSETQEASHKREQLARALERADDQDSKKKQGAT